VVRLEQSTFDQAVAHLYHSRTKQSRQLVWDFIRAMPTLYFVMCGDRSCSVPWITFDGDVPIAMLFTDYDRAVMAARSHIADDSQPRVVGLPTNAASMYISALAAQGIERVCINHGPQRFDAPISEVLLVSRSMKR